MGKWNFCAISALCAVCLCLLISIPQSRGISAGKLLVKCAGGITKASARFVERKFAKLDSCVSRAYRCSYESGDRKASCMQAAAAKCQKAADSISKEERKFRSDILKKCQIIPANDLLSPDALAFEAIAEKCAENFGIDPIDLQSIVECLYQHHECSAERIMGMSFPRTKEILENVGINTSEFLCLPDFTPVSTTTTTTTTTSSTTTTTLGDLVGYVEIEGTSNMRAIVEIVNQSQKTYCNVQAKLTIFDINDVVLYSSHHQPIVSQTTLNLDTGKLTESCLRPGDFGFYGFVKIGANIGGWERWELDVKSEEAEVATPDPNLVVRSVDFTVNSPGDLEYTVSLENIGTRIATKVLHNAAAFYAAFRNADNRIIDFTAWSVDGELCTWVGKKTANRCLFPGIEYTTRSFLFRHPIHGGLDKVSSIDIIPTWRANDVLTLEPLRHGTTVRLKAVSQGKVAYGTFARDGKIFLYSGGRGINIAVLDPGSGVIKRMKNFDTFWSTENSDKLIDFILSFPDGDLMLLSVLDEAAGQLTEDAKAVLEQNLGSRFIRDLGYQYGWAMITTKGRSTSIAEDIAVPGEEVVAETDFTLQ